MKKRLKSSLSQRALQNVRALYFDWKRMKTRVLQRKRKFQPEQEKLQIGAGERTVKGWLNVDLAQSDLNLDLTFAHLPFNDSVFTDIVSQHVIEHLFLEDEVLPLFRELHRVMKSGGTLFLATPDLEKICKSYISNKCSDLVADRKQRMPEWSLGIYPEQHMMNDLFQQFGEHKNLFDFDLLKWALNHSGFSKVFLSSEPDFLKHYPNFPPRNDDKQALYVKAVK